MTLSIGITGCAGRMGRTLIETVLANPATSLAGGTEAPGSDMQGQDLMRLIGHDTTGQRISDDVENLFAMSDAVIDFTVPAATRNHAQAASGSAKVYIVGTTGLTDADQLTIEQAARSCAVVQAPNFSLGVNILMALTRQVAAMLPPEVYDIEVLEMHHRHKIDAPSGTALGLGLAAAEGRGVSLGDVARTVRDGDTGARPAGEIGFATLRGGDVAGDHTVMFAAEGERVELTHKAGSRAIFARGAVQAALWAQDKEPGLYSMTDVLGL